MHTFSVYFPIIFFHLLCIQYTFIHTLTYLDLSLNCLVSILVKFIEHKFLNLSSFLILESTLFYAQEVKNITFASINLFHSVHKLFMTDHLQMTLSSHYPLRHQKPLNIPSTSPSIASADGLASKITHTFFPCPPSLSQMCSVLKWSDRLEEVLMETVRVQV